MCRMRGFSFLEVLFSLFLVTMLFLSVDVMLSASLRKTKINLYYLSAIQQLAIITERLKIMPPNVAEIKRWNQLNSRALPQGRGWLRKQHDEFLISIMWGGYPYQDCEHQQIGEMGCLKIVFSLPEFLV